MSVAVVNVAPDNFFSPATIARDGFHRKALFAHVALVGISSLARSHTGSRSSRRIEKCVLQVERLYDPIKRQLIEPAYHQALEDEAEHDKAKVAVNHSFTRLGVKFFICSRREGGLFFDSQQIQRSPGRQARGMCQKLADGDTPFVRPIEFQKVIGDRTVESEFAKFN